MRRRDFLKTGTLAGSAFFLFRSHSLAAAGAGAHIEVLLDEPVATVAPEIFGHFIEHLGGVIYDGVWVGENSKIANTDGIRTALIDRLKAIHAPVIRWPGGCFADSYDWRDGVGPRSKRPKRTDFWVDEEHAAKLPNDSPVKFEPNQFGTDDFARLCRLSGAQPYIAANLRSLPPYAFDQWVEYCNSPAGSTAYADMRAQAGTSAPYNVQYWGIGNESWGCGGQFTPEAYASEYRRFQAWVPHYGLDLKYVASGPNGDDVDWTTQFFGNIFGSRKIDPPFGWSLHYYTDLPEALDFTAEEVYPAYAKADRMEKIILDHWTAMGVYDHEHRVKLVVDEYGPWYRMDTELDPSHIFGQQITIRDAVMTALTLDTFVRHAEKVSMAACAQLVNCINSLFLAHEDHFIETPNFEVFRMYASHQGGRSVRTEFAAPAIDFSYTDNKQGPFGAGTTPGVTKGPLWGLNGSASVKDKQLTLTVTNPHLTEARETEIRLQGGSAVSAEATVLAADDIHAHNTFEQPRAVQTRTATAAVSGQSVRFTFPPSSVTRLAVTLS
ncbi:alpha-N-arabinofuranosidase [Paracidobacterium acidisoli]|uniref:non-reducing end alpha-L-arabinofuranosidase n=1 Tax=Paracidobacterium acidisoli TaxID=2303751 RepID=A0A372IU50_9BACT|nr:alpha-L-arabinofuranosidase C-terminal domain-containing protein [Paracidobacterium acidisoli]MBT9330491.1 alpha-L-arabinofuranosidase [Paracidobacterium acidisoli]